MIKKIKNKIHSLFAAIGSNEDRLIDVQRRLEHIEDAHRHTDTRLKLLAEQLQHVEHYQPIYNIAGLINTPARGESAQRAGTIEENIGDIRGQRILDIGSSLGYFSFYFADRGAIVEGWEENAQNAEVSRAISAINGVEVAFKTKELNATTVKAIDTDQFDTVLVLSVFHHIVRFNGLEYTQQLIKELIERVPVMVVELAIKGEDNKLIWDKHQPEDELELFDLVRDKVEIKKIGEFGTHLSSKKRPLYVVTLKKNLLLNGRRYQYDRISQRAYKGSLLPYRGIKRRYFIGKDYVVKDYSLDEMNFDINITQILNEIATLSQCKRLGIYHAPEMVDFDIENRRNARMVQKYIYGQLVSDIEEPLPPTQVRAIIQDVLKTAAQLQNSGIYHNDIRSWNTIIRNKSAWLIDYALAGTEDVDNNGVAVLWLANCLLSGEREGYGQAKKSLPSRVRFEVNKGLLALYDYIHQTNDASAIDFTEALRQAKTK